MDLPSIGAAAPLGCKSHVENYSTFYGCISKTQSFDDVTMILSSIKQFSLEKFMICCDAGRGGYDCELKVDTYDACLQDSWCRLRQGWLGTAVVVLITGCPTVLCALCLHRYRQKRRLKKVLVFDDVDVDTQLRQLQAIVWKGVQANRIKLVLAFKEADVDQSGTLGTGKLTQILNKCGVDVNLQQVTMLLGAIDADGDGNISYLEFLEYFAQNACEVEQVVEEYDAMESERLLKPDAGEKPRRLMKRERMHKDCVLTVTVLGCLNILAGDSGHKTSPYLELRLGRSKTRKIFRTSIFKNDGEPRYNESFEYAMEKDSRDAREWMLEVRLKDNNLSKDNLLGVVEISVADVLKRYGLPDHQNGDCVVVSRRYPFRGSLRGLEVDPELLRHKIGKMREAGKFTVPSPFGLVDLEFAFDPDVKHHIAACKSPAPGPQKLHTQKPEPDVRVPAADNRDASIQEGIVPWTDLSEKDKLEYLLRIAVAHRVSWLDKTQANSIRDCVVQGKFPPGHYLRKFHRKLLCEGMKIETRYIEFIKEQRRLTEREAAAKEAVELIQADMETITDFQALEPWKLVPKHLLKQPENFKEAGVCTPSVTPRGKSSHFEGTEQRWSTDPPGEAAGYFRR
eukprot:SAG31_NODE_852_length_11515_cov_6.636125_4_plen_624_part_00